jgi:charged multivesicular body protein 1
VQFTAKSLNRQSLKAGKEEQQEKAKLEKVTSYHASYGNCS